MSTTDVENFPGFPQGIRGPQLMRAMRAQAERWGARLITDDDEAVDLQAYSFSVSSADLSLKARALIIATGATAKRLRIPGEAEFWNNGISACAICDGANPLFRDAEVAVVGGGDSAAEEALYLTKYARRVHLLVRSDQLRASKTMQSRVLQHKNIQIHWQTSPISAHGDQVLQSLLVKDIATGTQSTLAINGLFYAIGHTPNTELFQEQLEQDAADYIITRDTATSVEGVWAAGDVQDHHFRQAITAAGTGCMAALEAERWLSAHVTSAVLSLA